MPLHLRLRPLGRTTARRAAMMSSVLTVVALCMAMAAPSAWSVYRWGYIEHNVWLVKDEAVEDLVYIDSYETATAIQASWKVSGRSCSGHPTAELLFDGAPSTTITVNSSYPYTYYLYDQNLEPGTYHTVGIKMVSQKVTRSCSQGIYLHGMGITASDSSKLDSKK